MTNQNYPFRAYGNDHTLYDWSYNARRAPAHLANGVRVSAFLIVPLEFFPLNPSGKPFKHPGAMVTPYPDLRHFTTRDYGNRVGVFRILKLLEDAGLKAVFPANAEVLRRYPSLIERIAAAGHEIAAHGLSTDHIQHEGLSEAEEEAYITGTLAAFSELGLKPACWMSPARNQSYRTPSLLARHGLTACLDWEMDQRPILMQTPDGPLTSLPNPVELSDFNLLLTKHQSEDEWKTQLIEAARYLVGEYETQGSQVFSITLTPYVTGLPFRIRPLAEVLQALSLMDGLTVQTPQEILAGWAQELARPPLPPQAATDAELISAALPKG